MRINIVRKGAETSLIYRFIKDLKIELDAPAEQMIKFFSPNKAILEKNFIWKYKRLPHMYWHVKLHEHCSG